MFPRLHVAERHYVRGDSDPDLAPPTSGKRPRSDYMAVTLRRIERHEDLEQLMDAIEETARPRC